MLNTNTYHSALNSKRHHLIFMPKYRLLPVDEHLAYDWPMTFSTISNSVVLFTTIVLLWRSWPPESDAMITPTSYFWIERKYIHINARLPPVQIPLLVKLLKYRMNFSVMSTPALHFWKKQGKSEGFDSCPFDFSPCDLEIWWITSKNTRAPLLYHIKLCAPFPIHRPIQTGVSPKTQFGSKLAIFCPVWHLTDGLEKQ